MRVLRTKATLVFYAHYPDDDLEADEQADRITSDLERFVDALPYVATGSVSVPELDTVPE